MTTNTFVLAAGRVRCRMIQDVPRAVLAAYEAAGVESRPFGALDAIDARLAAEASLVETREQLCDELLTGAVDGEDWIESARARLDRARSLDDVRTLVGAGFNTHAGRHVSDLRASAGADLAESIAAAVDVIARAAGRLPTAAPLDAARCVAGGSAEHLRTVDEALCRLGSMLGVLPQRAANRGVAPVADLLPLLDIPMCEPARVHSIAQDAEVLNPDPKRDGICSMVAHARHSQDEALVRALRGDYPGITFGLAWGRAEREERALRVRVALSREVVNPTHRKDPQ